MAINKIAGETLESNLIRSTDLSFNDTLLHLDVANGRIGVGTASPGNFALDVAGNTRIAGDLTVTGTTTTIDSQNLSIEDNMIVLNSSGSVGNDSGVMINRGAAGNNAMMLWDENTTKFKFGTTTQDGSTTTDFGAVTLSKVEVGEPTANSDASTKKYVDDSVTSLSGTLSSNLSSAIAAVTGMDTDLSTPDDSTFGDGALTSLTSTTKVTDAIDGLNETMENIRNSTYVKSVTYTANPTAGSLGTRVTLNISAIGGGANRYDVNWGDGTAVQTVTTTTPFHDYDENSGQPYTISVKAYNNTAVSGSSGSFANSGDSQTNQVITVYTSQPVPAFAIYAAASGGSPITTANSGDTVYLQNNTTNVAGASTTYNIDWGDTSENDVTGDNGVAGGSSTNGGTRLAHTYNNSANDDGSTVAGTGTGDTKYQIKLRLLTHTTADPAVVPAQATSNFEVYSAHTAAYAANSVRGINEEATNGFPVTFTNNTATLPGANSSFSATQQYTWNFGEGDSNTVVAVGSGSSGDTGNTINNTFNLTSGQQSGGTTVTYNTSLSLANGHTGSPYTANLNIIVEPDVRANIAATSNVVSTKSGDNQYDLYDVVDLDGANRALTTFTNTSQNADNYDYDFKDDSSDLTTIAENGSNAGSIGATLSKNFSGTSAGNFTTRVRAHGTPDTIFQDDEETINWQMNSTPSAPQNLSAVSLTLSDSAQGTSPKLCHGFTDNSSSFTSQSAGDSLNTTTARRYTSGTINTNTCTNFLTNNSNGTGSTVNQTLTAKINNASKGARTFTTAEGGANNTTDDTLVITNHRDADEVLTLPQRMFLVATAKITEALTDYSVGSNAQRLESSAGGNTNIVHVVRDDITAVPTTAIGTVAEGTAGSKRYVSGVPYYNTGSPTVTVTGTTIANFTGQAYQDTNSPHQVHNDTNQESTSDDAITDSAYTYAQVDGSTTMLSSNIPKTDIGVGSAYTIGAVTVPISTATNVKSVKTIRARSKNANGTGAYNSSATKIQVYRGTLATLDNEAGGITVSDSLGDGSTHTDDALRITGFGSSSDTPSFNSATNYYTSNAWSGAVTVAGTTEAISRFGTIKHFTTDLSSGYLPVGPDLNTSRDGGEAQYYTFAFRRTPVSQFSITMSGRVSGMFIAMPGTAIDSASDANGWLDCSSQYAGAGVPGADTGNGGNGSNGCAKTGGDRVVDNTTYSNEQFTFTLGTESLANSVGNTCLVRIKLNSGDSVTALSVGVAE
jgi:hypothetical protein